MYQKPFFIREKVSNNAFSYEKRMQPKLFVPALKTGSAEDVKVGHEIVFEDYNDDEKLCSCIGLENFIKTEIARIPTYIFDNHNHAFYFWNEEFQRGKIAKNALLIHIDQHKDNRQPESFLSKEEAKDLEKVFTYTNTVLNVGNFIPAAEHIGLVSDIIFINSEASLIDFAEKEFIQPTFPNTILDIDLDFFAPDFDYINNNLKLALLKSLIPKVSMITIATSPFFIEQALALDYLLKIDKLNMSKSRETSS